MYRLGVNIIIENESLVRLGCFATVFVVLALAEAIRPKKLRVVPRLQRWFTNISLVVLDSILLRLVTPILAVSLAIEWQSNGWGLVNILASTHSAPISFGVVAVAYFVFSIILLDLMIYWQHVLSHKLTLLWAFHKIHHTDRDIDVTTALRFHPLEILLSMAYKLVCVMLIGPSAAAVIVFEVLLNASAMFNHANLCLPRKLDSMLRKIIVTPDFHRVHHSVNQQETNSNYGFFLSLWDYVFGTYSRRSQGKESDIEIGLSEYQTNKPNRLIWCLTAPWKK